MEDPNILDLDSNIFNQIQTILESKSTRESFLKVVPPEYFSNVCIQLMENEAYKYHMSTARWLLFQFGKKGVRVSNLIQWLEEVNLERALVLLKKDVPIRITQQPPPFVTVTKGAKLSISCKASSYPPPEFQWFRGEEELLVHMKPQLTIENVTEGHAGIYTCLISKQNLENDEVSWIYTDPVQVEVNEDLNPSPTFEVIDSAPLKKNIVSDASFSLSISDNESSEVLEKISIIKQPYVNGKVPQGMSLCLHCQGRSSYPVTYQWYKNGTIINGAVSHKLHLNDLYPDPETGDRSWEYFCEVSNMYGKQFSKTAVVELENANESTPYYASGKYAFMVANDRYKNLEALKKPAHDVSDLGIKLQSMKYKVFAYRNLTLAEMEEAFQNFCKQLIPNCYILFYFAGHGFEQYGQMYLKPVDCSSDYNPRECICTEYILQCLQEENPLLNILLIDACRNLPPSLRHGLRNVTPPGEIFEAKMKNNTLYGYSTPFLYSAHESDSDQNSFFVKYLKKYITHNQSIQDVLLKVQKDFEGDPLIKGVQFPVIKTSLCGHRKLCDQILEEEKKTCLDDIKGDFVRWEYALTRMKSIISLDVCPHFNIFMNEIELTVSIHIEENGPLLILKDLEVNLLFDSPEIQVQPQAGVLLKDLHLKLNAQNTLMKKQIFGLQKIGIQELNGKLLLKFSQLKIHQEKGFSINIEKIKFINYLG